MGNHLTRLIMVTFEGMLAGCLTNGVLKEQKKKHLINAILIQFGEKSFVDNVPNIAEIQSKLINLLH